MVSVCMATYNGERFIKEQICSILPQLGENDELVISDDGSTDKTLDIIFSYNDKRIRVFRNNGKHGFVKNFENGLKHVRGDYIFLCDQDDIWKGNKLHVVFNELNDCDLVIHDAEIIDGDGQSLGKNYFSIMHNNNGFWMNLIYPRYLGCCMAFKKEILYDCLPIPNACRGHDYWIGCFAALHYKIKFVPCVLLSYRRHSNNATPSSEKSKSSFGTKVFKRIDMLFAIIGRTVKKVINTKYRRMD